MPTTDSPSLVEPPILYGVPFSQPVRAVLWLMVYKGLPFRMVPMSPGVKTEGGTRSDAYLAKNPGGTMPLLEEPDSGFVVSESNAILCYLSNRHGWTDVYPSEAQARARVDWMLHWHHRNLREASVGLVAPRIRRDLNIPEVLQQAALGNFTRALRALDSGWLARTRHLAGEQLTIADFAAYSEIGQLQPGFTNLFDFSPYPNVSRWLTDMKSVQGHDLTTQVLRQLGDLSQGAPELSALREANVQAIAALRLQGAVLG
jgi:glutathione S-transferase